MTWSAHPLSDEDIERIEREAEYNKVYCGFCEFGYGIPEDDCYCEESCGVIGCQGQKIEESA